MNTEGIVLLDTLKHKFIKQSELQVAKSPTKITKLNVLERGIHFATADIDIGFAATATLTKALKEKKGMLAMMATVDTKLQGRSASKYNLAKKLASLDLRLIVAEPDTAVKMFKQVLTKFVDTKGRTTEQDDGILTQSKKFVSEMKQFYHQKFDAFKFGEDRLDASMMCSTHKRQMNIFGLQSSFC